MSGSKFKVLLYADGSREAVSAAVYTAMLLENLPNIGLTIAQLQESGTGFAGIEYSWKELRPKYKRCYWKCVDGGDAGHGGWAVGCTLDGIRQALGKPDVESLDLYEQIVAKTNEIFSRKGFDVSYQILCTNISLADTCDAADALVDYAAKNSFKLIVMGTRGLSPLKGLAFDCLGRKVLTRSKIPVLLIEKLSRDFVNDYLASNGQGLLAERMMASDESPVLF
ncbi:Universal stress protein signature [Acididesulfobacillus acetoxydans]|uniref:Universal stress protein n=1 Tax=Acididesulfobacillus acetoxydans TaxID=1561005 RepID=A0A8S0X3B0_9FIRM|nr:universal stress protein [Acididesulfobacillus acetoxydans]CAA7599930.1 Universal stress protein signature [Acididesulfobacillus acetoxydans]CEJ07978.1 Universal stress protein [Acididesulfobacillus acetoxydans]